jgi:hypothetical protein
MKGNARTRARAEASVDLPEPETPITIIRTGSASLLKFLY